MDKPSKQDLDKVPDSKDSDHILLWDAWLKPAKPAEVAEKPAEKFSNLELAKASKSAADVITRNSDFGYSPKRDRLCETFQTAVSKGPEAVKQLTDAINKDLSDRKSTVRLSAACSKETETVDESPKVDNSLAVHILPSYYKHTYASGKFTLNDTTTGSVEDNATVRGRELKREFLGHSLQPESFSLRAYLDVEPLKSERK